MTSNWQNFIESLSINEAPCQLQENALYPLSNQCLLRVAGQDATVFLQGQFSCDVPKVTLQQSSLGSHNTAKGRMRSSFRIALLKENHYLLRVHSSIKEQTKEALAKYIVFSKAEAEILNDWAAIGLHGSNAVNALSNIFSEIPKKDYQQVVEDQVVLICTSEEQQSYEVYLQQEKAITLWKQLSENLTPQSHQQHRLLQHHLGLAFVEAGTFEEYIPQMFNYQATPAISFSKGCYTGQEIVARMHYLGKLKRHMYRYKAEFPEEIDIHSTVFLEDKEQGIGNIVSAVKTSQSQWDLLIVLTDEGAKSDTLRLERGELANLQRIELPYSIEQASQ